MNLNRFRTLTVILGLIGAVPMVRADWQEPKDGVVTEKELTAYLQVAKDAMDNLKAAGKAVDGVQSSAALIAVYMNNDAKFKADLTSHGLTQAEYSWVSGKAMEAWGRITMDQMCDSATKALAEQHKTNEQKIADLKQRLAVYQKAQADGRRVMTKEDRETAAQQAKSDQQSALDEARQHADEVKQALDDATKSDADAKAADDAAKNPPADIGADDRPAFVDQKKAESQQARDNAKQSREKADEEKKLQDDATAKAAAYGKKITDPDLAVTDDEKAEVKKENDDQITALTNDITEGEQGLKLLDDSSQTYAKSMQDAKDKNPVPQQNVDLLKKHQAEFEAIYGIKSDPQK